MKFRILDGNVIGIPPVSYTHLDVYKRQTQAAGLWEFLRNGSMSKVLHTANANLCGIRSARLAAEEKAPMAPVVCQY